MRQFFYIVWRFFLHPPLLLLFMILWDFSGLRAILSRLYEPWRDATIIGIRDKETGQLKPLPAPTFVIWFIGIYVALFGIASQRYENRIDIIENRINAVSTQLGMEESRGKALERIPSIQQETCPYKPEILNPVSVLISFFGKTIYDYKEGIEQTKETIEIWKANLEGLNFNNIDLSSCEHLNNAKMNRIYLRCAQLQYVNLHYAYIEYADLRGIHLDSANLRRVHFEHTILAGAYLKYADLRFAHLAHVRLNHAHLDYADLAHADLNSAKLKKAYLANSLLAFAILEHAYLEGVYLNNAILWDANCEQAILQNAQLEHADLRGCYFVDTDLKHANLKGADLGSAALSEDDFNRFRIKLVYSFDTHSDNDIDFQHTNFNGADLRGANLEDVIGATVEQLSKAKTLYQAKLDSSLLIPLKKDFPELFLHPDSVEAKNE